MAFKKMTDEERANHLAELEKFFSRKSELSTAPALMLKPGQLFVGEVEQITRRTSDYIKTGDGTYPVITLKDPQTGEFKTLHSFHTIMTERLKELKPQKGDLLFVKYVGEQTKNNATDQEREQGRDKYHLYSVDTEESMKAGAVAEADFTW